MIENNLYPEGITSKDTITWYCQKCKSWQDLKEPCLCPSHETSSHNKTPKERKSKTARKDKK